MAPQKIREGRPASPVTTFAELTARAHSIEGVPLKDLADYLRYPLRDPSRHKGYVGNLIQFAFGLRPNSRQQPDLERFRIEIKTVPIDTDLNALENTRLTKINPAELVLEDDWSRSHAFRKVTTILFVPVVKHPRTPSNVGSWHARSPFVWMPSIDELATLETDWLTIRDRYRAGDVSRTAIGGEYMFANAQSRNSTVRESYELVTGATKIVQPKAFYLLKPLTTRVLHETIAWAKLLTPTLREGDEIVLAPDVSPEF
jgi:DNA mismatch repair protein MutH